MNLQDVFDQLSYGELSQLFVGTGNAGEIPVDRRKKIAASVSLGLTELYKRFLLKEKRVKVAYDKTRSTYVLHSDYAETNTRSVAPVKYIMDTDSPFTDDVLQIERVYLDNGTELRLNSLDAEDSVRLTATNMFLAPSTLETEYLEVVYRANHPALNPIYVEALPSNVEIELPITHLEPLLLYVASRVHTPVGMNNEFHDGNNYAAKFEVACQRLDQLNMRVDTVGHNTRFEDNGWV
jgi:hypothetical protein